MIVEYISFCFGAKKNFKPCVIFSLPQSLFCPEKRSADKFSLPPQFQMLSEIPEASATILDKQVRRLQLLAIFSH